ncbi:uncharacterized protein BO72DRAFT_453453 [Aspergillus fijiensis CBS 313.89]|uniref:3'-5' exonuclease domain-containing protein n=1 Tax=Aspergillus fijiensis CBS 313.89 TaxID=1448319 RepID=A0A8G1RH54_9EURO|nr:uncharacterized protein BO72DRAFT_453453 [Aspergillus fijiensis CBS 313.89]RAK71695.1 hypothetical protein BO72DRAFT_453453 [Aspergillus fijiensis CBS 313.89]
MAKETTFIDTQDGLKGLVDLIARQDTWMGDFKPLLYIDLEGRKLSRHGTISLMTVLVSPGHGLMSPHVIDIHSLGSVAFSTTGQRGNSLKDILESPQIIKAFFDVRNDSDALYAHYGVRLQGVRDIQLMESAARPNTPGRKYLSGLSKCIEQALFNAREREKWMLDKTNEEALWNPEKGGSYSVFDKRPLLDAIIRYCVGDVQYLPTLYTRYRHSTDRWNQLIAEASQKRVSLSHAVEYQPEGPGRALSPWSPEQNKLLDEWNAPPPRPSGDYFSYDSDDDWYPYDDNDFEDWTREPWQGPPS